MDLSIFEQALSLRAEVEKAELDAAEPDFRQVVKEAGKRSATGANAATVVKPPEAPNEKLAMKFMMRGAALAGAAAASTADGKAAASDLKNRQSRIADMLRAASEPLAEFDPNAKGTDPTRPPSTAQAGSQPTATRPPVVGPVATSVATQPVATQTPPVATHTPPVVVRPLTTQPRPIGKASRAAESKTQAKTSTSDAKSATSTTSAKHAKRAKKSGPSTPTKPTPKKKR